MDGFGWNDRFGLYDELGDGEKVVPNDGVAPGAGRVSFFGSGEVTSGWDGLNGRVGAKSDAKPPEEDE